MKGHRVFVCMGEALGSRQRRLAWYDQLVDTPMKENSVVHERVINYPETVSPLL